jgi:hypothetical protein
LVFSKRLAFLCFCPGFFLRRFFLLSKSWAKELLGILGGLSGVPAFASIVAGPPFESLRCRAINNAFRAPPIPAVPEFAKVCCRIIHALLKT